MMGLLRKFVRSNFVLGAAIGISLGFNQPLQLQADCGNTNSVTEDIGLQDLEEVIGFSQEMHTTLFGNSSEPSIGYLAATFPSNPGTYQARNLELGITFEVIESLQMIDVAANLGKCDSIQNAGITNVQVATILVDATGSSGIPYAFEGLAVSWTSATGVTSNFVLPVAKVERSDLAMTVDILKYRISTPAGIVTRNFNKDRIASLDPDCLQGTEQEQCICRQQAKSDICVNAVERNYRDCCNDAAEDLAYTVIVCGASLIVPGIGWAWALVGCTAAKAWSIWKANKCIKRRREALRDCYDQFRIDLQDCGIYIYDSR